MFKSPSFNPAPNEALSVPAIVAASNPQTFNGQIFNPKASNNYMSVGTITMTAGVARLEGTSVWKII